MEIDVIVKFLKKDDGNCICPICGENIEEDDLIKKINENPEIRDLVKYLKANGVKHLLELKA